MTDKSVFEMTAEAMRAKEMLEMECAGNDVAQEMACLHARVAELEAEKAELEKDRERLDWLESTPHVEWDMTMEGGIIEVGDDYFHCDNIREAIDAARKEAQE